MTENKRFTMCHEQNDVNGWTIGIVDWETKEPFNYTTYEVHSNSITDTKDEMEDLCLLLNELNDENEQLKRSVQYWYDEHKRIVNNYVDKIKEVEKENEELKHFQEKVFSLIEDELEEHPYLTLTEKWNPNCKNYHSCRGNHEKNVFYASRHTLLEKLMEELSYD